MVPLETNMSETYLIEDILYLRQAAADHGNFTNCLRHVTGEGGVREFSDLLVDILQDERILADVVGAVSAIERLGRKRHDHLLSGDLTPAELVALLISGALSSGAKTAEKSAASETTVHYFRPIPNLMFTRDIGACVGKSIILSHPAKDVRRREGLLAQYIFCHHPLFAGIEVVDIFDDVESVAASELARVEGGDILVLDADTVVIGVGQRTSVTGAEILSRRLLSSEIVRRVILVNLPTDRATMHLDTVFTIIGPEDCVFYPPLFAGDSSSLVSASILEWKNGSVVHAPTSGDGGLFAALLDIGYAFPNRINCGGTSLLSQTREQWTDGANLFAARPRVAFIYERNIETIKAFEKAGYHIASTDSFLHSDPQKVDQTLVTLNGSELSRGRGGARCMTLPVSRNHS